MLSQHSGIPKIVIVVTLQLNLVLWVILWIPSKHFGVQSHDFRSCQQCSARTLPLLRICCPVLNVAVSHHLSFWWIIVDEEYDKALAIVVLSRYEGQLGGKDIFFLGCLGSLYVRST